MHRWYISSLFFVCVASVVWAGGDQTCGYSLVKRAGPPVRPQDKARFVSPLFEYIDSPASSASMQAFVLEEELRPKRPTVKGQLCRSFRSACSSLMRLLSRVSADSRNRELSVQGNEVSYLPFD